MADKTLKSITFPVLGKYIIPKTTVDATPTQGSTNAVSSGGVYSALADVREDVSDLKDAFDNIASKSKIEKFDGTFQTKGVGNGAVKEYPLAKSAVIQLEDGAYYEIKASGKYNRFIIYGCNSIDVGSSATEIYRESGDVFTSNSYSYTNASNYKYLIIMLAYNYSAFTCDFSAKKIIGADKDFEIKGIRVYTAEETDALVDGFASQIAENTTNINAILGETKPIDNLGTFATGGISSSSGAYMASYNYRIAMPDTVTIESDIEISIESGFRVYVAYFVDGTLSEKGWITSGTVIESGSVIRIMIAKITEDQSQIADIPEFCSAVSFAPTTSIALIKHNVDSLDTEIQNLNSDVSDAVSQVSDVRSSVISIVGDAQTIDKFATFARGGLKSSNGTYTGSYTHRVATPNITDVNSAMVIRIASGFRVYVAHFADGVFVSTGWISDGTVLETGDEVRLMIARTTETESETADITEFCNAVTFAPSESIKTIKASTEENAKAISNINGVNTIGFTWDWWITAQSVDDFGNAYIGYVDTEGYAGVIRRQPDGITQYKRLEKLANDDDHNGCATHVLPDGRILVVGSYGHTVNNHFICWRSTEPYSIDNMEKLSFDIPQSTYTYKTCYSQIYEYDGKIFDFFRIVTYSSGTVVGVGYACNISTDNGTTWTTYKVFYGTDGYQAMEQCSDDPKYLKIVSAINPSGGANVFRGCYIDLSTYKIYNLDDTEIGEMIPLNGGSIADDTLAQKDDMTELITQTASGLQGRLFFTAKAPLSETVFIYATAKTTALNDFTYKRYNSGVVTEVGSSGVGFGNTSYLSGMCIGNSPDTLYYSKATTAKADGNHELHKVKIANNAVISDEIVTEASMCILRPLFLGNGELATVVGHYNDQNSDGTYNGSFTAWELKPMFTRA